MEWKSWKTKSWKSWRAFSALTAEKAHGMVVDGGCAAVMDMVSDHSMKNRTS